MKISQLSWTPLLSNRCDPAICSVIFSQDPDLYHLMITAVKAATDPYTQLVPPGLSVSGPTEYLFSWLLDHLCQEVIVYSCIGNVLNIWSIAEKNLSKQHFLLVIIACSLMWVFANWVNAGLNLKHTSVVFAYCTNQEYIGLDTGLRITVTYSSNETDTGVSSSTPSSSGMTVQFVSKLSISGARLIFCWTVNYRKM